MSRWFVVIVLNFIGAGARWIWGTIWRTLLKKPKFKWSEYLHCPENPNYYDTMGHHLNNKIIGGLILCFILIPAIQLLFG